MTSFRALVVREAEKGLFTRSVEERSTSDLPEGDLLVRVHYSSLNYKDAMSATGHRGVTRNYPHTPGIDAAGIVEEDATGSFSPGDEVIVSGYDLGMNTDGGYGQYIRVPSSWALPLSELSLRESMVIGTAGFTAGMSLQAIEAHGIAPGDGPILVTGATGGLGSFAVAVLAGAGYEVAAVTGKADAEVFLRDLGASEIILREDASDDSGRPLLTERWSGVVDTVGGTILETAIRSARSSGVVTCCGLVASEKLDGTVYPFILRGVTLAGINSQTCGMEDRIAIWEKLSGPWRIDFDRIARDCSLDQLDPEFAKILDGQQRGRLVVGLEV